MNLSKGFILCQVRHKLTCQQIGVILRCRFADYQDETSQINQSSMHECVCVFIAVEPTTTQLSTNSTTNVLSSTSTSMSTSTSVSLQCKFLLLHCNLTYLSHSELLTKMCAICRRRWSSEIAVGKIRGDGLCGIKQQW